MGQYAESSTSSSEGLVTRPNASAPVTFQLFASLRLTSTMRPVIGNVLVRVVLEKVPFHLNHRSECFGVSQPSIPGARAANRPAQRRCHGFQRAARDRTDRMAAMGDAWGPGRRQNET